MLPCAFIMTCTYVCFILINIDQDQINCDLQEKQIRIRIVSKPSKKTFVAIWSRISNMLCFPHFISSDSLHNTLSLLREADRTAREACLRYI